MRSRGFKTRFTLFKIFFATCLFVKINLRNYNTKLITIISTFPFFLNKTEPQTKRRKADVVASLEKTQAKQNAE